MQKFIPLLLLLASIHLFAQDSFTISPLFHNLNSSTGELVVYNYSNLTNNSDGELQLRWVKIMGEDFPSDWTTTVQDPQTFWNDNAVDSADFVLGVEATFLDKIIMQFYPNGQPGMGSAQFKVYNINNPDDMVYVNYNVTVLGDPTAIDITPQPQNSLHTYPNPAQDVLHISTNQLWGNLAIIDLNGRIVWQANTYFEQPKQLDIRFLTAGIYFLKGIKQGNTLPFWGRFVKL